MFLRVIALSLFMLLSTACSSWMIRQDCKAIDWYKYGHSVAMQGRRLSGDSQVKKCQDAEYEVPYGQLDAGFKEGMNMYCQPKVVYSTGKSGDFFNPELCDPAQIRSLQMEHQKGLEAYCAVDNGYTAGTSGKKYQNVCPQKQEAAFLKEYRRGRRAYLNGKITEADSNMLGLERQSLNLQSQKNSIAWRLNVIPFADPNKKPEEDPYRFERSNLSSELGRIDTQINQTLIEKEKWLKLKGEYLSELATLQE